MPRVFPGAHDERAAAGVPADEASGERIAPARGKRRHAGSLRELDDHPVLLDAKSRVAMGAENDDVRGRGVMPPFVLPPRPVVEPPRGSVVHVPLGHVRTAFEDHGDVAVSLGVEGHDDPLAAFGGRGGQVLHVGAREPRAVERRHHEHVVGDPDAHPRGVHRRTSARKDPGRDLRGRRCRAHSCGGERRDSSVY